MLSGEAVVRKREAPFWVWLFWVIGCGSDWEVRSWVFHAWRDSKSIGLEDSRDTVPGDRGLVMAMTTDCCLNSKEQAVAMETMLLVWSRILVIRPPRSYLTPRLSCQPPRLPAIHFRGTERWRQEGQLVLVSSGRCGETSPTSLGLVQADGKSFCYVKGTARGSMKNSLYDKGIENQSASFSGQRGWWVGGLSAQAVYGHIRWEGKCDWL